MTEGWVFPDKLRCFEPVGTAFADVFKNHLALVIYAQYRRKHIVSKTLNESLPRMTLNVAKRITKRRGKLKRDLSLLEACQIMRDEFGWCIDQAVRVADWEKIIEPILPYLNGKKRLILHREGSSFYLLTEDVKK